jgi:putative two-component system response regulator
MHILAIDDEPDILFIVKAAVEESGDHTVVVSGAAEEALELAAIERPDGILMDVSMPTMDGYTALRRLRSDHRTSSIPVIFLTARAREEDIAGGIALGAAGYITKPFNPCLLTQRLCELIEAAPNGTPPDSPLG